MLRFLRIIEESMHEDSEHCVKDGRKLEFHQKIHQQDHKTQGTRTQKQQAIKPK